MIRQAFKFLFYWVCGLYLLGFSFTGANVYGVVDALIPFERVLCFALSMVCFRFMVANIAKLVREVKMAFANPKI